MNARTKTEPIRWFRAENGPGFRLPLWARTVALDWEGTVYAAAATTDDEPGAILAASQEGVPILFDKASERRFLPTAWMAREFPQIADICANIDVTVRMHLAKEVIR
jgi:hypothetical protein